MTSDVFEFASGVALALFMCWGPWRALEKR